VHKKKSQPIPQTVRIMSPVFSLYKWPAIYVLTDCEVGDVTPNKSPSSTKQNTFINMRIHFPTCFLNKGNL